MEQLRLKDIFRFTEVHSVLGLLVVEIWEGGGETLKAS